MDEELAAAKERSWRETAAIGEAYAQGELDDEGWHAANAVIVVPAYLSAETPEGGSGSSWDAAGWEYARSLIADAVEPGQTFLDNGFAVIRASLDFVPVPRRRQLLDHLLSYAGRVVIGVFNEEQEARSLEDEVLSWGFAVSGRSEREHPHPRLAYRAFWIDSTGNVV